MTNLSIQNCCAEDNTLKYEEGVKSRQLNRVVAEDFLLKLFQPGGTSGTGMLVPESFHDSPRIVRATPQIKANHVSIIIAADSYEG